MVKQKLIFRADGGAEMGLGHISRCTALAELLGNDFDIYFATRANAKVLEFIGITSGKVISLSETAAGKQESAEEFAQHLNGEEIIVLDGYHFTTEYERALKKIARAVVSIDDIPSRHFVADIILNFCGAVTAQSYSREIYTDAYTGLDYLFLRAPFLRKAAGKEFQNRLLINMGGSDPFNNTLKVLQDVVSSGYSGKIEIVVGSQYAHSEVLDCAATRLGCTIHRSLSAHEMYRLMCKCSLAILPPSTVALEFLSTGGVAFFHQTAANQALLKKYLQDLTLAYDYKDFVTLALSAELPLIFEQRLGIQKQCFDGQSLKRVPQVFTNLTVSSQLVLRKATAADLETCFKWANDPEARKNSYSSELIPWERHVSWFQKKVNDPACVYLIASIGTRDVGQVRFDRLENSTFQISYSVDKSWRGKGLGAGLLTRAVYALNTMAAPKKITGFVQKNNVASVKAFQRAGFKMSPTSKYPDSLLFEIP